MKTILTILLTLSFFFAEAQDLITIRGKIIDAKTSEAIPYAHVGIPEIGLGTTTTNTGAFTLKINQIHRDKMLTVSYIGYENFERKISSIDKYLTIKIEPSTTELMTIEVVDEYTVEDIIRKGVKNIPNNYPTRSTSSLGFYRQSRTDENNEYLYLAEGVLNIYKSTYKKTKEGQTGLVEGRQVVLVDDEKFDNYSNITSGHFAAHRFDFVKHREDFINEDYFPVYKYWIENITTYNGKAVYIIGFEEDPNGEIEVERARDLEGFGVIGKVIGKLGKLGGPSKKRLVKEKGRIKGRIFMEKETYAFIRAEFEITEQGLKKRNDYPLYAGTWKGNKYVVNYRQLGDKWYFGNALREGICSDGGLYSNEITITEIQPVKGKPIDYNDRLHRGSAFVNLTGDYAPNFWEEYNTTELEEDLAESVQQRSTQSLSTEVFTPERMLEIQEKQDSIKFAEEMAYVEELKEEGKDTRQIEKAILRKDNTKRWQFFIGAGAHLMSSGGTGSFDLGYLNSPDATQPILALNNTQIDSRNYEIPINWGLNVYFRKNTFLRFDTKKEFGNSFYRQRTFALGQQFKLTKQRPVYLRAAAGYATLSYARFVDQAINEYGDFEAGKKKFVSDRVNMYYGQRSFNFTGILELGVELRPGIQLYAKGSYIVPFAQKDLLLLWERERFFMLRKKVEIKDADLIQHIEHTSTMPSNPDFPNPVFLSIGVIFN